MVGEKKQDGIVEFFDQGEKGLKLRETIYICWRGKVSHMNFGGATSQLSRSGLSATFPIPSWKLCPPEPKTVRNSINQVGFHPRMGTPR